MAHFVHNIVQSFIKINLSLYKKVNFLILSCLSFTKRRGTNTSRNLTSAVREDWLLTKKPKKLTKDI